MKPISLTEELAAICGRMSKHDYVTVDTEFIREKTYWPNVCLIQIASPDEAVAVDPLADGLDLAPFFDLMRNEAVIKVFHAGRQDIEIIYNEGNFVPHPVFDTQVAAMVCGFGDSASYEQLAKKITGVQIDKTSRFTDWSRRPLSQKQMEYALSDVTHLREIYRFLSAKLAERNRSRWVQEEMEILTSVETYAIRPENAWKRIKTHARNPYEFAVLQEIAAWREIEARRRNVPRGYVIRDEAISEIAAQRPRDAKALAALRTIPKGFERSTKSADILGAVQRTLALPKEQLPEAPEKKQSKGISSASVDLLKVLLKMTSEVHEVAAKVIANVDDLEKVAEDDNADVAALKGWRRELFGERALSLKHGEIALAFRNGRIVPVRPEQAIPAERNEASK